MTYLLGALVIAAIAYAVYRARASFGKAPDNSTGTPHAVRDDLR